MAGPRRRHRGRPPLGLLCSRPAGRRSAAARRARAWYSGPCLRGSAYSFGLIVQYVPLDVPYQARRSSPARTAPRRRPRTRSIRAWPCSGPPPRRPRRPRVCAAPARRRPAGPRRRRPPGRAWPAGRPPPAASGPGRRGLAAGVRPVRRRGRAPGAPVGSTRGPGSVRVGRRLGGVGRCRPVDRPDGAGRAARELLVCRLDREESRQRALAGGVGMVDLREPPVGAPDSSALAPGARPRVRHGSAFGAIAARMPAPGRVRSPETAQRQLAERSELEVGDRLGPDPAVRIEIGRPVVAGEHPQRPGRRARRPGRGPRRSRPRCRARSRRRPRS